jgi:hypothetical protein
MGNTISGSTVEVEPDSYTNRQYDELRRNDNINEDLDDETTKSKYRSFPGSAMLEKTFCGSIDTTDPSEYDNVSTMNRILKRAEILCVSSPLASSSSDNAKSNKDDYRDDDDENSIVSSTRNNKPTKGRKSKKSTQKTSKLLARALVSEVTDNPKTMTQAAMTDRERKLLLAAAAAASPDKKTQYHHHDHSNSSQYQPFSSSSPLQRRKPVGVADPPHFVRSVAYACTGDDDTVTDLCSTAPQQQSSFYQSATNTTADVTICGVPGGKTILDEMDDVWADHPNVVTIGVALSRHANNYDRNGNSHPVYGHPSTVSRQTQYDFNELQDRQYKYVSSVGPEGWRAGGGEIGDGKMPDEAHIPIIRIHCPTEANVDAIITALASGEIFIPHVQIMPEQLTVHNCLSSGSTNLVVHFGCERNDDVPVEEWPNWCLEFLHNQLYEYFAASNGSGAIWMKRSFSTTLAKQVRWKTVKHMNRYFASAEKVIASWRDMGPQSLTPTPSHLEGGASADEVARPHGIYLYRGGVPTNYFCPNFEPPYTTKMTRSLLMTVLQKSWDKKRREWSSKPVPRVVEPSALLAAACGYASDVDTTGYMAHKATTVTQPPSSTSVKKQHPRTQSSTITTKEPLSVVEFGRTFSEDISLKENSRKNANDESSSKKSAASQKNNRTATIAQTNSNGAQPVLMDDTDNNVSVAPSALNTSVAESGTTVLHANSRKPPVASNIKAIPNATPINSHHKILDVNTNARRLYSDEDFLDDLSSVDTPPGLFAVTSPRGAAIAAEAEEQRRQQQLQQQLQPPGTGSNTDLNSSLQRQLTVVRQSALESPTSSPTKRAQVKLDQEKRAQLQPNNNSVSYSIPARTMTGTNIVNKVVGVEPSSSLEYSTDGSSAFFFDSNMIAAQQSSKANLLEPLESNHSVDDDNESTLLSIQESSSSIVSAIPTDEELFSVGWAKALDANSGNYYYFTLDRTRTVWENPLSASQWGGELPPPVMNHPNPMTKDPPIVATTTKSIHRPIDP